MPDTFLVDHRGLIIRLAAEHGIPAIYTNRIFAAEGGLISYGFEVMAMYRSAASYADRIIHGAGQELNSRSKHANLSWQST